MDNYNNTLFINIELLKIFLTIGNVKWDTITQKDKILAYGNFIELKHILSIDSNNSYFRCVFEDKYLLKLKFEENLLIITSDEMSSIKKIQDKLVNLKKYQRILSVCKKYSNNDIVKTILLIIALSSSILVCSEPQKNQLEDIKDEKFLIKHEANMQARISSKIVELNNKFKVVLENKYNIDDSYLKPDITIDYYDKQLKIELKTGNIKSIVNKFKQDIEKIKKYYDFAIALAYDPKQFIRKEYDIYIPKKEMFYINFQTKDDDNVYFIVDRVIESKLELRNKIYSREREKRNEYIDKVNLAFYIENK